MKKQKLHGNAILVDPKALLNNVRFKSSLVQQCHREWLEAVYPHAKSKNNLYTSLSTFCHFIGFHLVSIYVV